MTVDLCTDDGGGCPIPPCRHPNHLPFSPASRFLASATSGRPGSASFQRSRNSVVLPGPRLVPLLLGDLPQHVERPGVDIAVPSRPVVRSVIFSNVLRVFASNREGDFGIYWKAADGTGKDEKLVSVQDRYLLPYSFTSDGKILVIAIVEGTPTTSSKYDIGVLSMEGDRKWKPLLQEKYTELQPQISPDGRWMAYISNESGRDEVYVRPFPEVDKGQWQVSTSGGAARYGRRMAGSCFTRSE